MKKFFVLGLLVAAVVLSGCVQPEPMPGSDRDEHGCIPSAGYSWCEAKQKCLRPWEEDCALGTGQFNLLVSDAEADIGNFNYLNVSFGSARIFKTDSNTGFEEFEFEKTVDLTKIVGEKAVSVLEIELPEGTYTKIELDAVGIEAMLLDGNLADIKIPSGTLRIVKPFAIDANKETTFVFDIGVAKKGQGNEYNLLPVVGKSGVIGKDLDEDEVEETGCVTEGETMPVYPGFECCIGLVAINPTTPDLNCEPLLGASICSKCGNGTCEQWENYCNCPEDCEASECRDENYGCTIDDTPCCEGLIEVPLAGLDESTGLCIAATCGSVCRPCGNGVCDASENVCSCPADCPREEFCGNSTLGACSADSGCIADGCSGQFCRSTSEEPVVTTCEFRDCFNNEAYGLECKCSAEKCKWAPATLEAHAETFCNQENLEGVYICGEYIKVTSSLLGGGSTFYSLKEDNSLSEPIDCRVVGPDSMSEECNRLLYESNCIELKVC